MAQELALYAELYSSAVVDGLSSCLRLNYARLDWSDEDVQALARVLPICAQCERIYLNGNERITTVTSACPPLSARTN